MIIIIINKNNNNNYYYFPALNFIIGLFIIPN